MTPELHTYYISYSHTRGFGATSISLAQPIRGWSDIEFLMTTLEAQRGIDNAVILSWQRFEASVSAT